MTTPRCGRIPLGIDPVLSMVLTLPIAFLFGMAVQKLLLDAVVGQPELTALLVTFGLGLVMVHTAEWIFTTDFRTIPYASSTVHLTPRPHARRCGHQLAERRDSIDTYDAMLVLMLVPIAVAYAVGHSRFGVRLNAIREDEGAAEALGIDASSPPSRSPRSFVDEVLDTLVELARGGLTVALVEQNAARALEISDRAYVLELGRNRCEGTGRELLDDPTVRRLYLGGGLRAAV